MILVFGVLLLFLTELILDKKISQSTIATHCTKYGISDQKSVLFKVRKTFVKLYHMHDSLKVLKVRARFFEHAHLFQTKF